MDNYKMSEKTDGDLLRIVEVQSNDYQAAALEEAKAELTKRCIPFKEGSRAYTPLYYAEQHYDGNNRFWDYLIDMIVATIITYTIFFLFGTPQEGLQSQGVSMLIIYLYYFLTEGFFGKTVGKFLLGLKVVDIDGNKPSWGAIALRSLCRFIPFEPVSFLVGGNWTVNHTLTGNWHDALSKTYVVKVKKGEKQ